MFAGAQKLIDGWWPVVVGLWARALVGKGRGRSEGRDGREAQIPNKQMWHHE